jgi:hypothetical protein
MSDDPDAEYSFEGSGEPSIFGSKLENKSDEERESTEPDEPEEPPKSDNSNQSDGSDGSNEPEDQLGSSSASVPPAQTPDINRSSPRTFMVLAPELRNKIYEYALVASGSIHVTTVPKRHDIGHLKDLVLRSSTGIFDYEQRLSIEDIVTNDITPALLQSHPTFLEETRRVLYGRNKFSFRGILTFARFLTQIGQNRAMLRDVEILEATDPEDVDGAAMQFAMGLLADAALNLKHIHFGTDIAAPFVDDPDDRTRFLLERPVRIKKMAKYVLPCVARIFRLRHLATGERAEEFLDNVFSVHPSSFDPDGGLPRDPFLKWENESHFEIWNPTLFSHDFLVAANELRYEMHALLEAEGRLKIMRHREWKVPGIKRH